MSDDRGPGLPEASSGFEAADDELSARIREAVAACGSKAQLAAKSGIPERTLGYLLAGQDAKLSQLRRIAQASGLRLEWLASGEGPRTLSDAGVMEAGEALSGRGAQPSVVRPLPGSEGIGLTLAAFDPAWLDRAIGRPAENLALARATGDAMAPHIRDGDVVMVDTQALELVSGRLYLVDLAGELQLRRIQRRLTGSLLLLCDNDRFPPEEVRQQDGAPLRILGEVVWHSGVV